MEEKYRVAAENFLLMSSLGVSEPLFVAVHVRRGDYLDEIARLNGTVADRDYFVFALDRLTAKLTAAKEPRRNNIIVIVVSNDYEWTERRLADLPGSIRTISAKGVRDHLSLSMSEDDGKLLDLALMWSCHHVIFDYGTYGLMGALFAGQHEKRLIVAGLEYKPDEDRLPTPFGLTHANMSNLLLIR